MRFGRLQELSECVLEQMLVIDLRRLGEAKEEGSGAVKCESVRRAIARVRQVVLQDSKQGFSAAFVIFDLFGKACLDRAEHILLQTAFPEGEEQLAIRAR